MYTAKESSSETPMHTPIGDSSSQDEILFTKRRCTRCIINKTMSTRRCRDTKQPERRSENRGKVPNEIREVCCPPKVPNFPVEESNSGSVPSIPDLFPFTNCQRHEFHHNIVSMESPQVALLTKDRVQVKKTENSNLKITFNDDSDECICIHVPNCRDGNSSEETTGLCKSCPMDTDISECRNEKTSNLKETCYDKEDKPDYRQHDYKNHFEPSKEKGYTISRDYHGKTFPDCDEKEKHFDFPERSRKYEVIDKQCRDFDKNVRYRIERAINPDTTVIIDGQEYRCHLMALQVYSKKIDEEAHPALFRLELPSSKVSVKTFQYLMDWILASEESKNYFICSENVIGLYCASKYLKIVELNLQCSDFIQKQVSEEDPKMISLWEETRGRCDCDELQALFSSKLSRMFMKIYKSGQFLHFKVDEMIMILENDSLCITSEMDVYDAVVRWLLYDWKERNLEVDKIMRVVRFGLISPVELMKMKHCMQDPHYPEIFTCKVDQMIQKGVQYSILSENYNRRPGELKKWIEKTQACEPRPRLCLIDYYVHSDDLKLSATGMPECCSVEKERPETPEEHNYENITDDRTEQIKILLEENELAGRRDSAARIIQRKIRKYLHKKILILGGCDPTMDYESRKASASKIYSYEDTNWEEVGHMPVPRTHFAVVSVNKLVYVIGGLDPRLENHEGRSVATKSVYSWNVESNQWTQVAPMNTARSHFGCVSFNGLIYAFGGQDEKAKATDKCEMYNPERNKWTEVASLEHPTFSMAITKNNDFIWLIGGLTQMRRLPLLDTVSIYKPEDNSWTYSDINFPFSIGFASALAFKREIYVFAGVNKFKKSLATVFRFDFEQLIWIEVGHLQLTRHANCLIPFGTSAILVGGVSSDTQDVIATVECFNLKKLNSQLLSRLPSKMTGVAGICLQ